LQDLIDVTHMVARVKVVPATLNMQMLSENERKLCEKLSSNISIAVLSRMWQMLIKGISELNTAPIPLKALEMILIRVAYSANLPTPMEILSEVKKNSNVNFIQSAKTSEKPKFEPEKCIPQINKPEVKEQINIQQDVNYADINFGLNDFVAYLEEHKKMLLLYGVKNDISIEEFSSGHIKMAISEKAAPDFMQNFNKELETASGIKWQIEIRRGPLGETLADKEKALAEQDKRSVSEYPLVKAILSEFPGAKIDTVVRKAIAQEKEEQDEDFNFNTYEEE